MTAQPLPLHPNQHPTLHPTLHAADPAPTPAPTLSDLIRQYADHAQLLGRMSHPYAQTVDTRGLDVAESRWLPLEADDDLDLWLISWPPDARTGWHDHGGADGAFTVLDGALSEATWDGRSAVVHPLRQGMSRAVGGNRVHDLVNTSGAPALSLHAYSPGLSTMTHYSLVEGPGGCRLCVAGVEMAAGRW